MTCQNDWPAAARKSTNRRASSPKSPMPNGPGRDVGCKRKPVERADLTGCAAAARAGGGVAPARCRAPPRGADAGVVQIRHEALEKAPGSRVVFRVHLEPGVDEG